MPRIYIAGPITNGDLAANINRASDAFLTLVKAGFAPFCPHLSCFAGGTRCPSMPEGRPYSYAERLPGGTTHEEWVGVDLPWVGVSDALLRLPGESVGADREVAEAKRHDIPVLYSLREVFDLFDAPGAEGAVSLPPSGGPGPSSLAAAADVPGESANGRDLRSVAASDHLVVALSHVVAWLAGDTRGDRLERAGCALLLALDDSLARG